MPYIPFDFFQERIINEKEKDHSLLLNRASSIKSNHHKLEDNKTGQSSTTAATTKRVLDDAAVSLSLTSNTSQLFWLTKAGNNSDANDVSLELTLA